MEQKQDGRLFIGSAPETDKDVTQLLMKNVQVIISLNKDPLADFKNFTIKHFYINDLELTKEEYAQEIFKVS